MAPPPVVPPNLRGYDWILRVYMDGIGRFSDDFKSERDVDSRG